MDGKGKIWLVPVDKDGLEGEPIELSGGLKNFSWEDDREDHRGLDGGLSGEQTGATERATGSTKQDDEGWDLGIGRTLEVSWSLDLGSGKVYELWALMTGLSVEQVKDLLQWAEESKWLRGMTGDIWNLV